MNKLEGLYELKKLSIPTIDWKVYEPGTKLDSDYLWTVRTAVYSGNDLCLPRLFGQNAVASMKFARWALEHMGECGIVIYYPYLIAEKSGNLQIGNNRVIIEAVRGDLSNLLTNGQVDVTYVWDGIGEKVIGDSNLMDLSQREQVMSYVEYLKRKYKDEMLSGNELQLEFSFAFESTETGEKRGRSRLVFWEIRTV